MAKATGGAGRDGRGRSASFSDADADAFESEISALQMSARREVRLLRKQHREHLELEPPRNSPQHIGWQAENNRLERAATLADPEVRLQEVTDKLNREALGRPLTAAERAARIAYATNSGPVNARLRGRPGRERADNDIRNLDSGIGTLKSAAVLYRGVPGEALGDIRPGSVIRDAAYQSTTLNRFSAMGYARSGLGFAGDGSRVGLESQRPAVLRIRAPKGTRVVGLDSETSGGYQVVLDRNTSMRVNKITPGADGIDIIDVTVEV